LGGGEDGLPILALGDLVFAFAGQPVGSFGHDVLPFG
jgi:hypothetical protein